MPDRRLRWGIIALAVAVRAAAVLALQSHRVPNSTYEHGPIAANLLAGRGFSVRFLGAEGAVVGLRAAPHDVRVLATGHAAAFT